MNISEKKARPFDRDSAREMPEQAAPESGTAGQAAPEQERDAATLEKLEAVLDAAEGTRVPERLLPENIGRLLEGIEPENVGRYQNHVGSGETGRFRDSVGSGETERLRDGTGAGTARRFQKGSGSARKEGQSMRKRWKPVFWTAAVLAASLGLLAVPAGLRQTGGWDLLQQEAGSESTDGSAVRTASSSSKADVQKAFKGYFREAKSYAEIQKELMLAREEEQEQQWLDGDVVYEEVEEAEMADMAEGSANGGTNGSASDSASGEAHASKPLQYMKSGARTAKTADKADAQSDYSTTNLREMGIDEGDVVKTDGQYIYSYNMDGEARIVGADGTKLTLAAKFSPEFSGDDSQLCDMYIREGAEGKRLVFVGNVYDTQLQAADGEDDALVDTGYYALYDSYRTTAVCYDISDPEHPKQTGSFSVEGSYQSSRISGDQLYLFTWYHGGDVPRIDKEKPKAADVYLPQSLAYQYTTFTMTSVALEPAAGQEQEAGQGQSAGQEQGSAGTMQKIDTKVIYSSAADVYVTADAIILQVQDYSGDREKTNLLRFSCEDGIFRPEGIGVVPGTIESSFSIDEDSEGNIRVATTSYGFSGNTNGLYIFDRSMERIGKLTGIAKGEEIKSARFLDKMLYLVTFENHDPLFAIDLSDPRNPKMLGQLEIPGFSDYLHFWDDTHLLGIGYDTDEETSEQLGIKLSMFDISDPMELREESTIIIRATEIPKDEDKGWHMDDVPGLENYRSILMDPEKNLIGFAAHSDTEYYESEQSEEVNAYYVYSYENGKFVQRLAQKIKDEELVQSARGLYIGQTFYYVNEAGILSFDMGKGKQFEKAEALKL